MSEYMEEILKGFEKMSAIKTPKWVHAVARIGQLSIDGDARWQRYFEAPFDAHMRDHMTSLCQELKQRFPDLGKCHVYQDEITIEIGQKLLAKNNLQTISTMLASEASVILTLKINKPSTFRCNVVLLPSKNLVNSYFDCLMAETEDRTIEQYANWLLRLNGHSTKDASGLVDRMTKNQAMLLLKKQNYQFEMLPEWQRVGVLI